MLLSFNVLYYYLKRTYSVHDHFTHSGLFDKQTYRENTQQEQVHRQDSCEDSCEGCNTTQQGVEKSPMNKLIDSQKRVENTCNPPFIKLSKTLSTTTTITTTTITSIKGPTMHHKIKQNDY